MDLATIIIDPEEAKARLAEYEAELRQSRNVEDEAMAAGLRAAVRGLPIIQLSKCITMGGTFDNGLPRLAVARADQPLCVVEWDSWGNRGLVFHSGTEAMLEYRRNAQRTALVGADHVRIPLDAPEGRARWQRGKTIIPSVPPRFRPKNRKLHRYHVLWEVEEWTKVPPIDPALIKHIRGDLWSVHAVWDLTELERAVLAAR